jgi:hypothetical protein
MVSFPSAKAEYVTRMNGVPAEPSKKFCLEDTDGRSCKRGKLLRLKFKFTFTTAKKVTDGTLRAQS